jgi:predicted ATP-dependent endonuclease of OLD family
LEEIVRLLKRIIESRGECDVPQIIFTTHSPYVLSQFRPEEVTLMSRRGNSVIARSLADAPHIEDRLAGDEFYLGELWYNLDEEELFSDGRTVQSP